MRWFSLFFIFISIFFKLEKLSFFYYLILYPESIFIKKFTSPFKKKKVDPKRGTLFLGEYAIMLKKLIAIKIKIRNLIKT